MSSYIINNTNGDVLTTIIPGTTNDNYGLTLIGQNFTSGDNRSWGEIQNENFVRLLENFASAQEPGVSANSGFLAVPGQLWWDSGNQRLMIYNGTDFIPASEQTASPSAPTVYKTGDQWFDTINQQFKIYNGTAWEIIGPGYTAGQGKSGSVVETIVDTTGNSHTVVNTYTNNHLVSITSYDTPFTPNVSLFPSATAFSTVQPGVNLAGNVQLNGTTTNSVTVGGVYANAIARSDISTTFASDVSVIGNVILTNANISFGNKSLVLQNKALDGGFQFYVNTTLAGNISPLSVSGTTGLATVYGNPTTNLGIATKGYVDGVETRANVNLAANVATLTSALNAVSATLASNIATVELELSTSITSAENTLNSAIDTLAVSVNNQLATMVSNISTQQGSINTINGQLPSLASISSPTFTGTPSAPTPALHDNSTTLATTEYVDREATALINDYTNKVAIEVTNRNNAISSAVSTLAPIDAPSFTGVATAATPSAGDNSTRIATTGFVTQAITAQKFNYTVSSGPPSGGNDGDFWFQVG